MFRILHGVNGRLIVAIGASLAISACSIANPYRYGDDTSYRKGALLAGAVAFAEDTREKYYDAITEQTLMNRGVGVLLIGAASAAAFLGLQGGNTKIITGLGVGGAGLFAVNSILYSQPRLGVYVAGAKAISCTLGSFASARAFDSAGFEEAYLEFRDQYAKVKGLLADSPGGNPDIIDNARAEVEASTATLINADKVRADLNTTGVRLFENVQAIHANVTTALIATEPDLVSLVATLGTTIPANASLLTGPKLKKPEDPLKKKTSPRADEKAAALARETTILELARRIVDARISLAGESPSDAALEACAEFASIKPFSVLPRPTLVVDLNKGPSGLVRVSGGKAPYSYGWVGQAPGAGVTLEEASKTTAALSIRVTGDDTASGQTFQLVVQDNDTNSATILVTFVGKSAAGETPTGTPPGGDGDNGGGGPTTTKSDTLEELQGKLIALGCMAATRDVAGVATDNKDGFWGDVTEAAIAKLKAFIEPDVSVTAETLFGASPADGDAFYDGVLLKVKDLEDNGVRCP